MSLRNGLIPRVVQVSMAALSFIGAPSIRAQTSDVVTRPQSHEQDSPTQVTRSLTSRQSTQDPWQRSLEFDHGFRGGANSALRPGHNSRSTDHSIHDFAHDALIGSDPDLAKPLVPCDALGTSPDSTSSIGTPGGEAGLGYDPATGSSAIAPPIASCESLLSTQPNDTGVSDRDGSAYDQFAPDVDGGETGRRTPGTLTRLRPFAD